ncbi:ABC transporter ATP-binding protein [Agromyces sp. MMS24-K17]|uniref:ABC transporter ATP-binding protein n=1 Tax=Agromyces sp. MMS24-K17 TaxID=3372850 RepID=UPI0037550FF3
MTRVAPAISARALTRTYGSGAHAYAALRGVSLDIDAGERVAIVGRSGSGKSTLMHLLALLDTPDAGSLRIAGDEVGAMRPAQVNALRNRHFGFVFQQFFLNARQSVLDNVQLPLVIGRVRPSERRERAMAALEAVGLAEKHRNRASDLSGGQKQRVVIARALVNDPAIIFADEPTGNLDTQTGERIEDLLFELNRSTGITLVTVTHDLGFAERFDRRIHLRDGEIVDQPTGATGATGAAGASDALVGAEPGSRAA